MKNYKKLLIVLCITIANTFHLYAQNAQQAKRVLDKVTAKININKGAYATFTIKNKSINTSGSISMKGNKFYTKTSKAIMWFNGKTQWTYINGSDEINVSNPSEAQQAQMNPYKFLTLYKNGYNLSMTTTSLFYNIRLKANKTNSTIKDVHITINKQTNRPTKIKILQKDGWTTIDIKTFVNKTINDNIFNFNQKDFPRLEIIDLR